MMAAGLFANAFPSEPSSPPVRDLFCLFYQVEIRCRRRSQRRTAPPDHGRRLARKYHAIMATAWLISAQPEPVGGLAEISVRRKSEADASQADGKRLIR